MAGAKRPVRHNTRKDSLCLASAMRRARSICSISLDLLREAKSRCDFLIAGVVADDVLIAHKGICPMIPPPERLQIVRNIRCVDAALPATTNDKLAIWRELRVDILFNGDDWRGIEKGNRLERDFAAAGVEVVYFPFTKATWALQNIETGGGVGAGLERCADADKAGRIKQDG
jgi:glycerol-3-phosphate cytidylyltransferase